MKNYYTKGLPSYHYNLKGKSDKIYNFFGYEFDDKLNINRENERTIFYVGKTNKGGTKLLAIVYVGIANKVSEIKKDKKILNFIKKDFTNHYYFVYDEIPFDIEVKFRDIQDNYNFQTIFKY